MSARILLVRHPPVARAWVGRCYGASDMGWSLAGAAMAHDLAASLAAERPSLVVHSDLTRTQRLATMIAARSDAALHADPRWRERDFGRWEGRTWHAIWRESGDLMDRMVTHPTDFRPGGGETTADLVARARQALAALPGDRTVIVVAHGGPIAAARLGDAPFDHLPRLIPATGEVVRLSATTR